jgi:NDP-sugar pyrophosphorylase family protein
MILFMKAVILAGGLGTRISEYTKIIYLTSIDLLIQIPIYEKI